MFYDWLTTSQTFSTPVQNPSDRSFLVIDTQTSEIISESTPRIRIQGSYSTSIEVHVSGNTLRVRGNPSRIDRIDNLFGYTDLDDCFAAYNRILSRHGLPEFTKNTEVISQATQSNKDGFVRVGNGAQIHELHITSNVSVGRENVQDYIAGLSAQRIGNSLPRLHTDGNTVDWLSPKGHASLIYHSVYNKAYEIALKHLTKAKKAYGENSPEYKYLQDVHYYCQDQGVVRFEQKLKSRYLSRNDYQFWGHDDFSRLTKLHENFLATQNRLKVSKMNLQTINQELLNHGIVKSVVAANTTAHYFNLWLHGQPLNVSERTFKTHRARLRLLGIDIANRCNLSILTPIRVKSVHEIETAPTQIPNFYKEAI